MIRNFLRLVGSVSLLLIIGSLLYVGEVGAVLVIVIFFVIIGLGVTTFAKLGRDGGSDDA